MRGRVALVAALCGCHFDHGAGSEDAAVEPDAAPPIDAPPDAPPMWTVIETLTIDTANPSGTLSQTILQAGVMYHLRASGTASVIDGTVGDSEYYDFAAPKDNACCEDVGIGIDDPMVDLDTTPNWGPYAADHIYEITYMGMGRSFTAAYQDTVYGNNSGNLTLEILAFQ